MTNAAPRTWLDKMFQKGIQWLGADLPDQPKINFLGNVSVADDPENGVTTVTVSGNGGQESTPVINGLNSDVATGGLATLRLSGPTAAFSVGGFALPGGSTPSPGQVLDVINTTAQVMTVEHNESHSTLKYRISVGAGVPSAVPAFSRIRLVYDGTASLWVLSQAASVYRREFDVREYGADPTGAVDSTSAINAANAAAASVCGIVIFPPGTFTTSGVLNISDGVTWKGAGRKVTIINNENAGNACVLAAAVSYWGLQDLQIMSAGDGIQLSCATGPVQHYVIHDVWVAAWGTTNAGINFINNVAFPTGDYNYFGRLRNVDCFIKSFANQPNSKCVTVTGTATSIIGLSWIGGRMVGGGIGLDLNSADGSNFLDIEFDEIQNLGTPATITSVDTGTGIFTTSGAHGFSVGDMVFIPNAGGITGLADLYFQVASVPTSDEYTLYNVGLGGSYSGSHTVQKATGIAVHFGAACTGCTIQNPRIETSAVDRWLICDVASYINKFQFIPYGSPAPSQISDPSGTNIILCSNLSNNVIDVDPWPWKKGGITQAYGWLTANSLILPRQSFAPTALATNDNIPWGDANSPVAGNTIMTVVAGVLGASMSGASGYAPNDTITVASQNGGAKAVLKVLTVSSGNPTSFSVLAPGGGYTSTSGTVSSTSGGGSGGTLTLTILTGAFSITGINPGANVITGSPADGQIIELRNETPYAMSILHANGSSLAKNQILCPTGMTVVVPGGGTARLEYDAAFPAWRCRTLPAPATVRDVVGVGGVVLGSSYAIVASASIFPTRTGKYIARIQGVVSSDNNGSLYTTCNLAISHTGSTTPDILLAQSYFLVALGSAPIDIEIDLSSPPNGTALPLSFTPGQPGAPGTWYQVPAGLQICVLMSNSNPTDSGAFIPGYGLSLTIEEREA